MYTDTITLFNRHKSSSGEIWYPSVLRNVNLNMDKASIVAKFGAESKNRAVLGIMYKAEADKKLIGDKTWLPPKEWQRQNQDLLDKSLTFTSGQQFDFFFVGEFESDKPIIDDDFNDGFYNYMKSKYDFVFAVEEASFFSVIPHFEIIGK